MKYLKILICLTWILVWNEYKAYNASFTSTGCTPALKTERHVEIYENWGVAERRKYMLMIEDDVDSNVQMYEVIRSTP